MRACVHAERRLDFRVPSMGIESVHAGHILPMSLLHGRKMAGQIIAGTSLASTFGYYTPPAGMGPFVDHGCPKDQRLRPEFLLSKFTHRQTKAGDVHEKTDIGSGQNFWHFFGQ